jgi:hypothetical protein
MDFVKKHYEKLVLGLTLLLVAGIALALMFSVSQVKEDLRNTLQQLGGVKQKTLAAVDLSTNEVSLAKVARPASLVLSGPDHHTFNPIPWARAASGRLEPTSPRPGTGPAGIAFVNAHDLFLEIGFDQVAGTPEAPRYQFTIRRDYEKTAASRRPLAESLTPGSGSKDQLFRLLEVKGPKEDPAELLCELIATREPFVVTRQKSFRRTQGYSADLRYEAERKEMPQRRVGDSLLLSGTTYKIVAIEKDELVISAPNSERTTVPKASAQ